jgi:chromate transporter
VNPGLPPVARSGSLREVAGLFAKLGFIAFGGPAAHIALMREEVVKRRKWVSDEQFLDLVGASNLIPGPTSTELAIYLGYVRAGWRGLILGGALFILPAAVIVLGLAWAYVRYGSMPEATWLLYGIKPAIIAVVVQAIWALARTAVKGPWLGAVGALALALYLYGFNELILLFGGGILVMLFRNARRLRPRGVGTLALLPVLGAPVAFPGIAPFSLGTLFLTFLKIGAVLYGSGYVLLAFLRNDFVIRLHWLTDQQLIDAVAVGQFTPGPVFTTATFIGYLIGGFPGALVATVAIFLPSFAFVAAAYRVVNRLRSSPWTSGLLDGVNVAALGLMAAVTYHLARAAIVDWLTAALALSAAVLLIRFKVNSVWLVIGGGAVGVASRLLTG